MRRVAVNGRFKGKPITGVQRYAVEVTRRLEDRIMLITPKIPLAGALGHWWEQVVLPFKTRRALLWSPCGSGPIAVSHQVLTIHDLAPIQHPEWFGPTFTRWYGWLLPRLVQKVAHIIAVSQFTKASLVEVLKIPEEKVSVVPNGANSLDDSISGEEDIRRLLNLPSPYYILYVGSLQPRKNVNTLLKAWSRLAKFEDIWLVLAGAKGNNRVFAELQLDVVPPRVYFAGYVPDAHLASLYRGAIALVYPSLYEGFGIPPLEAMALGTPVIASNVTAIPEVVGDAGLLVDPYDPDSIAEAIRRVIEDKKLRDVLRSKGRERAKQFTWDRTAEETWKILMAVASESSSGSELARGR